MIINLARECSIKILIVKSVRGQISKPSGTLTSIMKDKTPSHSKWNSNSWMN